MNEKIAIEILKQANIETTAGCCEKCPRKDKNKTCIGCLDDAKDILLNHINNLQSKIDKAIDWIEQYEKQIGTLGETSKNIVLTDDVVIGNLLDILKENK